jgi:hypothetical protein
MPKLTQEQLEAIRQRAENATAGPWFEDNGDVKTIAITDRKYTEPEMIAEAWFTNDATFIAHARTDIPALLDHIAELEAELTRLKQLDKVRELYAWAKSSRDKFAKDDDYTKADARVDGILLTLEALGIKIEGVND